MHEKFNTDLLKFNARLRKPGESVASYVAELRSLSEHCEFNNTLEEMLRDRLVCGINNEHIQRRLLAGHSLDFKKALKIATSMETAIKSSRELANQMAKEEQRRLHNNKPGRQP